MAPRKQNPPFVPNQRRDFPKPPSIALLQKMVRSRPIQTENQPLTSESPIHSDKALEVLTGFKSNMRNSIGVPVSGEFNI